MAGHLESGKLRPRVSYYMVGDLVDALAAGNISATGLRVSYRHLYISRISIQECRHLNIPVLSLRAALLLLLLLLARNQTGLHARANYIADIGAWRSDISRLDPM